MTQKKVAKKLTAKQEVEILRLEVAELNALQIKLENENKTLKDKAEKIKCYLGNVDELIEDIDKNFIDQNTGKFVKVNFKVVIRFIQKIWDKIKETSKECHEKEIKVQFKGFWKPLVSGALSLIGLKL